MIIDNIWKAEKVQQFREADADGLVGMRGYLNYFQDAAASYMAEYDWGNDTVHEKFGVAWVYTKYRMQMKERTIFDYPLQLECWIEQNRHLAAVTHDIEIRKGEKLMAVGRLESCIMDIATGRIAKLDAIAYDRALAVDKTNGMDGFTRISTETEGMEYVYSHRVRYTDLDNNRHLTNLRYIPIAEDAFELSWYDMWEIEDLEIHYRNQCYYGEELRILRAEEEDGWRVAVAKQDGSVGAVVRLRFRKK